MNATSSLVETSSDDVRQRLAELGAKRQVRAVALELVRREHIASMHEAEVAMVALDAAIEAAETACRRLGASTDMVQSAARVDSEDDA